MHRAGDVWLPSVANGAVWGWAVAGLIGRTRHPGIGETGQEAAAVHQALHSKDKQKLPSILGQVGPGNCNLLFEASKTKVGGVEMEAYVFVESSLWETLETGAVALPLFI